MKLLLSALLALLPSIATAHDWYPWECCSDNDCAPIDASTVRETRAGYFIEQNGETLSYSDKRVRVSPDGQTHLCTVGGMTKGKTLCLFRPPMGF